MIKVKNLENIQDNESIAIDKLSGFISDMHSKTNSKIDTHKEYNKKNK